jgi:hypothetical protein
VTIATDYVAIWDSLVQAREYVRCNLCGGGRTIQHKEIDRYGFLQGSEECVDCGLNFLNPRMTREAYARFYETAYRPLVSAFHGREINAQTIQPEQEQYGHRLGRLLTPYKADYRWRLLDIGGSTGVVAKVLAAALEMTATVIDPAPDESILALNRGLGAIPCFLEEYEVKDRTWDLITMCQTADHLLDLMGSLKKIKGLLADDGLFWSDIVDFDKTREVKIDHPFNLTESTYRRFLDKAGFELKQINYSPDRVHIGFLCRAAVAPFHAK